MEHSPTGDRPGRVLVTGGSGFIGTHLVERLLRDFCTVINVDVAPPKVASHTSSWERVDILDTAGLKRTFDAFKPELVVHLAAITALDERAGPDFYAANIEGVQNVIDVVSRSHTVERVIFASSRLVNRIDHVPQNDTDFNPGTRYGVSKMRGEQLVRQASNRLPTWTIVRPTGIWGPWFGVPYRDFFLNIARGRYVHPAGQDVRKSFGYVENTVHQLVRLAHCPAPEVAQRTFLLADSPPISVRWWANRIQQELQAPRIRSVPMPALQAIALAGDAMVRLGWNGPPLTTFRLRNLTTEMVFDTQILDDLVGALPYTPEEGVKRTVRWLRAPTRDSSC